MLIETYFGVKNVMNNEISFTENKEVEKKSKEFALEVNQSTKVGIFNENFASVVCANIFTPEQCNGIVKSINEKEWENGNVLNTENSNLRIAQQQSLPMNVEGWPHNVFDKISKQVNEEKYKFNILGFFNNDLPMLVKYSEGGHYDWHIDCGRSSSNRKISFTVQLTDEKDYEGGDLEFIGQTTKPEVMRKQGTITLFPSFLGHRITKVTKGERYSIVGWIHGDAFK